jgi:hypothetical protein
VPAARLPGAHRSGRLSPVDEREFPYDRERGAARVRTTVLWKSAVMSGPTSSPSQPLRSFLAAAAVAPLGLPLVNPFRRAGTAYDATLQLDADADTPAAASVLRSGAQHRAVVRVGAFPLPTGGQVPTLAIKIADAYGPGRDQDFLLATSGNGAPAHHFLVPASRPGERLFSSLWFYLAGLNPVLVGVLPVDGSIGTGTVLPFALSGPIGRFHRVGALSLGAILSDGEASALSFSAAHDGGGLRALPPTRLYHDRD